VIQVHLVLETPDSGDVWSCAEIRLLRPYQHHSLRDVFNVSYGRRLPNHRVDVVVLQRTGPVGASIIELSELLVEAKRRGARIIYDLDDDLTCTHPIPEVETFLAASRPKVRLLIRESVAVVVSTKELAERLRPLHSNVVVWENAIDETLIPPFKNPPVSGIVGYFGTNSHLRDLLSVRYQLSKLSIAGRNFSYLELCGISDDSRLQSLFRGTLKTRCILPQVNYSRFHAMLAERQWSVGIAPLIDAPFNAAKSAIKLLDYAAASIPVVASDAEAYRGLSSGTSLIVQEDAFADAVLSLLGRSELASGLARAAYEDLHDRHTLRSRAGELRLILESILV
jgi:glycosyltransferase involved in cell wall biosynthesis